jgi:hypothetical protein
MLDRPHVLSPSLRTARIVLCYKNFAAGRRISHIGLGVAAINTCKVLREQGVQAEVWACRDAADLRQNLVIAREESLRSGQQPISHVAISAPWIPTADLAALARDWPEVVLALVSHSNVGFLQADAGGVRLLRESFSLCRSQHNFCAGGNSLAYTRWVECAFEVPCHFLPNLYHLDGLSARPAHRPWRGGMLRIGCFGAIRPLKNHLTAAATALAIRAALNADLEFWISSGRSEGGGNTVLNSLTEMLAGLPGVRLCQAGWQGWPEFRGLVRSMHLLLQLSYTESFNMVTADGIAESVPSVVSEAIDWAPRSWQVSSDDALEAAEVGRHLLADPLAANTGLAALEGYNQSGIAAWKAFLLERR